MDAVLLIALGLVLLTLVTLIVVVIRGQHTERATTIDQEAVNQLVGSLKSDLTTAQAQALQSGGEHILALVEKRMQTETERGEGRLKERKEEIDVGLKALREELGKVREFVQKTDATRGESVAKIGEMVERSRAVTEALSASTAELNKALAGGQARGQWGERMAEDVLRVAGFIEGVQYRKQTQLAGGGKPDFTFLLPDDRVLHMDVKFPLAEYMRYLSASAGAEQEATAKAFIRDVRSRIKEVATRDYIDPDSGTLDYTLVFIPNEQVYGFVHERDPQIIEFALANKVIVCSPLTLFAILAVIRQAADNFRLARQTDEILSVLGEFSKKWTMFKDHMQKVEKNVDQTHKTFHELQDTRSRMLDVQIRKVETLRTVSAADAAAGLPSPGAAAGLPSPGAAAGQTLPADPILTDPVATGQSIEAGRMIDGGAANSDTEAARRHGSAESASDRH